MEHCVNGKKGQHTHARMLNKHVTYIWYYELTDFGHNSQPVDMKFLEFLAKY